MEIGIYIAANIIYLGQELCLGDRVVCSLLLGKRVVTTPFAERHFSSVLWPLAGDVWRITCSFIALALDIHVLWLRREAESAILHSTKKVLRMHSEFNISCGRGQGVLVASPQQEVRVTKCGRV